MCGGFTLTADRQKIIKHYKGAEFNEGFIPTYNARPSNTLPVLTQKEPGKIVMAKWGLPMSWEPQKHLINVRYESREKRMFLHKFKENRCIIPADGFFEWEKVGSRKVQHGFIVGNDIFSMAGLFETTEEGILFAIITVPANQIVSKIHDRMPAILSPYVENKWLAGDDINLEPFDPELMKDEVLQQKIDVNRAMF